MSYSLEGIVGKIHRANQLIHSLNREVSEFREANYRVDREFDAAENTHRFRAFGEPHLPVHFSILVGEVLYHLRSSLDHVITHLNKIGPGGGRPERLEFPICATPAAFKEARKSGKIEGIPDSAKETVEKLQPYNNAPKGDFEKSPLYWVHELNRIDKHRLLIETLVVVKPASSLVFDSKIERAQITGLSPPPPPKTSPSKEGTEVFHITVEGVSGSEMKIEGNFSFRVALDHPGSIGNAQLIPAWSNLMNATASSIKELCHDFDLAR